MNDDLQSKTDEELRSIMQTSRANQYLPTSIYHRAKDELDSRAKADIADKAVDEAIAIALGHLKLS